jgi:hypothetical protein
MLKQELLHRVFGYGLAVLAVMLICISPGVVGATVNDDDSITAQVKSALAADPSLGKRQIQVNTYHQRVLLTGFVENQKEAVKAIELATSIDTVKSVQNNLMIQEGPGPHVIPRLNNWQSANP